MSSTPEVEWDDEQCDLIEAEQIVRDNTGPLGEWLPEATDDAISDPMSYSGKRYVTSGPFFNWAVKAEQDAMEAHRKSLPEGGNAHGVFFRVEQVDYSNSSENSGQ